MVTAAVKLKDSLLGRKAMTNLDSILKSRYHFDNKGQYSQSYGYSISLVWMWEPDSKRGWVPKNRCLWTVVLEKTLESPLNCKETNNPVNPKRNQCWIFTRRTDDEAEAPILWPPYAKRRLIEKDPADGNDWRQEEREWQRVRWLDGITDSMDFNLSELWEMIKERESRHAAINPWGLQNQTRLSDWTTTKKSL